MAPSYIQPTNTVQQKALAVAHGEFRVNLAVVLYPFYGFNPCRKGERRPSIFSNFGEKIRVKTITHVYLQALCHGMRGCHEACMRGATMRASIRGATMHQHRPPCGACSLGPPCGAAMWGLHSRGLHSDAGPPCSRGPHVRVLCGCSVDDINSFSSSRTGRHTQIVGCGIDRRHRLGLGHALEQEISRRRPT